MSLAEKLAAGPARPNRCAVCQLETNLPEAEAAAFLAMLHAPANEWSDEETLAALQSEGHLLHLRTAQSLGHHRRRCGK